MVFFNAIAMALSGMFLAEKLFKTDFITKNKKTLISTMTIIMIVCTCGVLASIYIEIVELECLFFFFMLLVSSAGQSYKLYKQKS